MPYKDKEKQREAQRIWARGNRETQNIHRTKSRRTARIKVQELKTKTPCKDCDKNYPHFVMQFDHRPNSNKIDCIGMMVSKNASWKRIEEEISKCELVCANCHAIRTYTRIHNGRASQLAVAAVLKTVRS